MPIPLRSDFDAARLRRIARETEDARQVRRLLALHRSGRAERSFQLWNLLNLSKWFDHWIAGQSLEAGAVPTG